MDSLTRSRFGWLRIFAFLEGVSFVLLLFIAMPLKYLAGQPEYVRAIGMAHGVLFLAYLPLVLSAKAEFDWPLGKTALAMLASLLPFGTFWAEYRIFRPAAAEAAAAHGAGAPAI
ncbi:MAG: rane protein [Fibrobacteres bacterium]|nr:rane protein [Fibrobacterota bacterium]